MSLGEVYGVYLWEYKYINGGLHISRKSFICIFFPDIQQIKYFTLKIQGHGYGQDQTLWNQASYQFFILW